jgi:hypothetical protein
VFSVLLELSASLAQFDIGEVGERWGDAGVRPIPARYPGDVLMNQAHSALRPHIKHHHHGSGNTV